MLPIVVGVPADGACGGWGRYFALTKVQHVSDISCIETLGGVRSRRKLR